MQNLRCQNFYLPRRNGNIVATLGVELLTVLLPTQEIENMGLTVERAAMEISLVLVLPRVISAL